MSKGNKGKKPKGGWSSSSNQWKTPESTGSGWCPLVLLAILAVPAGLIYAVVALTIAVLS